jgi:hypothetical protein
LCSVSICPPVPFGITYSYNRYTSVQFCRVYRSFRYLLKNPTGFIRLPAALLLLFMFMYIFLFFLAFHFHPFLRNILPYPSPCSVGLVWSFLSLSFPVLFIKRAARTEMRVVFLMCPTPSDLGLVLPVVVVLFCTLYNIAYTLAKVSHRPTDCEYLSSCLSLSFLYFLMTHGTNTHTHTLSL